MMKAYAIVLTAAAVGSGCMATSKEMLSDQPVEAIRVSLCEIRSHERDFVGTTTRVRAVYATDGFTFSDLRDESCKDGPAGYVIINKDMHSATDATLRGMIAYQDDQCSGKVVCNFMANLDADITLRADGESGGLGTTIEHVYAISRIRVEE